MQEWADSGEVKLLFHGPFRAATAHYLFFGEMAFPEYQALGPRQEEQYGTIGSRIHSLMAQVFFGCQALCQPLGQTCLCSRSTCGADHWG